ncbi:DUF4123 domain-containing protein [Noviherbaspirillum sp.]|uniref:DUF4123 domain-containing protein n=1 Tax=Noviherbaspirillum sp. TaxID=1926288 RepID=UPI002D3C96DF|nr:DUF4123 domain-containing protein [Noviherbaspirillum sp.]HZW19953.1 DUF4123 domain-containing protein [Noviherbaspirillum sp.]
MGQLRDLIIAQPRANLYAVADAASLPGLLEPMYAPGRRSFACLLPGEISADVAHVAPYLIALHGAPALVDWLDARLALPWGYVVQADAGLLALQLHLRRFTETRGPNGEEWLFRFWDPRVLRTMPDILTPAQTAEFMAGIARIYLPGPGAGSALHADWDAGSQRLRFAGRAAASEQGVAHAYV